MNASETNDRKSFNRIRARFSLLEMLRESEPRGWSAVTLNDEQIRRIPHYLRTQSEVVGYELIPNRRGQGMIDALRPLRQAEAHPNSLSSRYGLEQQPLHTDGAHLEDSPDIVLLWSENRAMCQHVFGIPIMCLPMRSEEYSRSQTERALD